MTEAEKVLEKIGAKVGITKIDGASVYMNGLVCIEVKNRTVEFCSQSIFLHGPKYPEAAFLKLVRYMGAMSDLVVADAGTEISHVNFLTDKYLVGFVRDGIAYQTTVSFDRDGTLPKQELTVQMVVDEIIKMKD